MEPVRSVTAGRWKVELLPKQPYEARFVADRSRMGFTFETQRGTHAFASDRIRPYRSSHNGFAFVPRGCEVFSASPEGGEYLVVTGFELDDPHPPPFSDLVDRQAIEFAHALRRALLAAKTLDTLHVEALVIALRDRLEWLATGRTEEEKAARWMTPSRLNTIIDQVEASLDQTITVESLARAVGLSEGFFSRAFKASTGCSPYAYVLERRVARARALLARGEDCLVGIALDAGFSSHAHLSSAFRQSLGISPRELRRSIRS